MRLEDSTLNYCIMCFCKVCQGLLSELADSWGWYSLSMDGKYPPFSSNGANFVVWLMLTLIVNSIKLIQFIWSFWLGWISVLNICPIKWFICSVIPSVWGWNDVDMRSLAPRSLCSSLHHSEVNFESLSLTMDLGSPCSHTISRMYIPDNCDAIILVCMGTRHTILVILHTTTHR